jgi:hypothetical protein
MRIHHEPRVDTTVLDTGALLALAMGGRPAVSFVPDATTITPPVPLGAWLSADGAVRLDINTDGTYAGQVAGRRRRAHGTYDLDGATLTLRDDSGLATPVTVHDGELQMAGHRLAPV